jgi:hypothetical protein
MPNGSPEGLLANRAVRLLRNDNHAAVDIVLANEMALLAGFAAAHVLILAANIANSFRHAGLLPLFPSNHTFNCAGSEKYITNSVLLFAKQHWLYRKSIAIPGSVIS